MKHRSTQKVKPKLKLKSRTNTRKNASLYSKGIRKIIQQTLEILHVVRLYHWNTASYSVHKATDELYSSVNTHVDNFVEVLLGKTGYKININDYNIILHDKLTTTSELEKHVNKYKTTMIQMKSVLKLKNCEFMGDLNTIRDEIVADLNTLLYQLTLK
jgi:DNA-binding ferritin-like protein